jgi:hypothetical protein
MGSRCGRTIAESSGLVMRLTGRFVYLIFCPAELLGLAVVSAPLARPV